MHVPRTTCHLPSGKNYRRFAKQPQQPWANVKICRHLRAENLGIAWIDQARSEGRVEASVFAGHERMTTRRAFLGSIVYVGQVLECLSQIVFRALQYPLLLHERKLVNELQV